MVGCICGLAGSTSSASALRCCRCCRVARRGTVCPAPLPLGTACPIPCSSPHCTPVRVSCAPLPAKARVGPACSALPPPAEGIPWPFGHAHIHRVGWVGKKFGWLALDVDRGRCASGRSRAGGSGCCGCERVGVRRCPGLGCAVVPRVRGAVQTEFFSSVASLKNCTRSASLKFGLRTRNTHRGRRPPEDEPKGQGARRAAENCP